MANEAAGHLVNMVRSIQLNRRCYTKGLCRGILGVYGVYRVCVNRAPIMGPNVPIDLALGTPEILQLPESPLKIMGHVLNDQWCSMTVRPCGTLSLLVVRKECRNGSSW